MMYPDFANINFSKYQRFFAIGCSFTNWYWPTWADIIAKEHAHLDYYNFGHGGSGNLYISSLLSQINRKFKLNKRDIVVIMWSTFHRPDYYTVWPDQDAYRYALSNNSIYDYDPTKLNNWKGACDQILGAINDNYIMNDNRGYLIRDCALIDNTIQILEGADYDSIYMMSTTPDEQLKYDDSFTNVPIDDVLNLYENLNNNRLSLLGYLCNVNSQGLFELPITVNWIPPHNDETGEHEDEKHFSGAQYCDYLEYLNFQISQPTKAWVNKLDHTVKNTTRCMELISNPSWKYDAKYKGEYIL